MPGLRNDMRSILAGPYFSQNFLIASFLKEHAAYSTSSSNNTEG